MFLSCAVCLAGALSLQASITLIPTTGSQDGATIGTLYKVMQTMLGDNTYNANAAINRVDDANDQTWTTGPTTATTLLLEIAGHRTGNEFGIYNLQNKTLLQIFPGSAAGVSSQSVSFDGSGNATVGTTTKAIGLTFGFYVKYNSDVFYSRQSDNSDGGDYMVTLKTSTAKTLDLTSFPTTYTSGGTVPWNPGEFLLGWEDVSLASGDKDYQDMLIKVAVPEPTTLIAGALLLLPFGASTMRFLRRKQV